MLSKLALVLATGLVAGSNASLMRYSADEELFARDCAEDNCFRAMFPCRPGKEADYSSAVSFCSTVTAGASTATDYPPDATAACGSSPEPYLSVCACGPYCTPAPTAEPSSSSPSPSPSPTATGCTQPSPPSEVTPLQKVFWQSFECGLGSWMYAVFDNTTQGSIAGPGYESDKAFVAYEPTAASPGYEGSLMLWSNQYATVANVPGTVRFAMYFDRPQAGSIGVKFNGEPKFYRNALDDGAEEWHYYEVGYTPQLNTLNVSFHFYINEPGSKLSVDSVSFAWLH